VTSEPESILNGFCRPIASEDQDAAGKVTVSAAATDGLGGPLGALRIAAEPTCIRERGRSRRGFQSTVLQWMLVLPTAVPCANGSPRSNRCGRFGGARIAQGRAPTCRGLIVGRGPASGCRLPPRRQLLRLLPKDLDHLPHSLGILRTLARPHSVRRQNASAVRCHGQPIAGTC
jgi:hypothetical protein